MQSTRPLPAASPPPRQIAVEGCCHGELDKIYDTLLALQQREGRTVDLLICCGDFQVTRPPQLGP
jgi:hypothetical protein